MHDSPWQGGVELAVRGRSGHSITVFREYPHPYTRHIALPAHTLHIALPAHRWSISPYPEVVLHVTLDTHSTDNHDSSCSQHAGISCKLSSLPTTDARSCARCAPSSVSCLDHSTPLCLQSINLQQAKDSVPCNNLYKLIHAYVRTHAHMPV